MPRIAPLSPPIIIPCICCIAIIGDALVPRPLGVGAHCRVHPLTGSLAEHLAHHVVHLLMSKRGRSDCRSD